MKNFEYINKVCGTKYKSNKDINWNYVSCLQNLSELFIEKYQNKVDWYNISAYQKLSESFIEKFQDKVSWRNISIRQKLSEDFIEKFQDKVDWMCISIHQKLSESFIIKFKDKVEWSFISVYQTLSEAFIEKFFINDCTYKGFFKKILMFQNLSIHFLIKYSDILDFDAISKHQFLTESFIEEHQDKVNWEYISKYQKLSESFIEKFQDKVYWTSISMYQKLSESFISKYQNILPLSTVSTYQKLSDEFIKINYRIFDKKIISKYQKLSASTINYLSLNFSILFNWQYKSIEYKKQKLIITKKYECHDDYFIAYKAIKPNRYSLFNFQYQYLPGETYESNCDCTSEENSFGLNVGTYNFAKGYLGDEKGIIIKCKINYEDIGRIVHNGEKVRCFKITVLN